MHLNKEWIYCVQLNKEAGLANLSRRSPLQNSPRVQSAQRGSCGSEFLNTPSTLPLGPEERFVSSPILTKALPFTWVLGIGDLVMTLSTSAIHIQSGLHQLLHCSFPNANQRKQALPNNFNYYGPIGRAMTTVGIDKGNQGQLTSSSLDLLQYRPYCGDGC